MRPRFIFSSRRTRRIDPHNKHKKDFKALAKEVVLVSDIVLEILDARFIEKTRNKIVEDYIISKGKKIIFVINKSDLVDTRKMISSGILRNFEDYVFVSSTKKTGGKILRDKIKILAKRLMKEKAENEDSEKLQKYRHGEGFKNFLKTGEEIHVGVIGYPNTGKSSVINLLAGGGSAKTSPKSGFTKGIHKSKLSENIILLDTPGIITEEDSADSHQIRLAKHALIGARTYDSVKNPDFVVAEIMKEKPGLLEKYYGIDAEGDSDILLEELGKKLRILKKGGVVNVDKTARKILRDWQEGKIR